MRQSELKNLTQEGVVCFLESLCISHQMAIDVCCCFCFAQKQNGRLSLKIRKVHLKFIIFMPLQNPGTNHYYMEYFLKVGTVSQQPFNFFSCCYCSNSKLYCYCPVFVQLTFTGLWERIRVSWLFSPFLHKLLIKDIPWMTKHCILCHTVLTRLHEQQFKNTCLHCSLAAFFFFFYNLGTDTFLKGLVYHLYKKIPPDLIWTS